MISNGAKLTVPNATKSNCAKLQRCKSSAAFAYTVTCWWNKGRRQPVEGGEERIAKGVLLGHDENLILVRRKGKV